MKVYIKVISSSLNSLLLEFCNKHQIVAAKENSESDSIDILFFEVRSEHLAEDLKNLKSLRSTLQNPEVILFNQDISQDLLIQAMRIGIREVLSDNPVPVELDRSWERCSLLAKQKAELPINQSRSRYTVSFMPCKGGTGATLMACNLGYFIAEAIKQVVVLIDMDLHAGDATFYLSNDKPKHNISDITRQIDRLDGHLFSASLHPVAPNYHLLAAPTDAEYALTMKPENIDKLVNIAQDNFDLVLIDLNPAINAVSLKALDHSDIICIVLDYSITQLRDAKRLLALLLSFEYPRNSIRFIAVNHENAGDLDSKTIEESLGMPILLTVPAASKSVVEAFNQGLSLSKVSGGNEIMIAIQKLAHLLFKFKPQKSKRWLSGWF
jgi:pilus assembly protein CpaE